MALQLSNLEHLPNYQITERLDVVYGSTVRSKHVGKDLFAGLKNIVGGELTAYTELLEDSRQEAIDRMIVKAEAFRTADAVVGLRFSTSSIAQGASELFVYGTAVKAIPMHSSLSNTSNRLINTIIMVTTITTWATIPSQSSEPTQPPSDDLPRFNPFG